MPSLDKETTETLSKQQTVSDFVQSDGWSYVRAKLIDKIMDLQSIKNIDSSSPENAVLDLKVKNACVDILIEWLKEIEGEAAQGSYNLETMRESQKDEIIKRF